MLSQQSGNVLPSTAGNALSWKMPAFNITDNIFEIRFACVSTYCPDVASVSLTLTLINVEKGHLF